LNTTNNFDTLLKLILGSICMNKLDDKMFENSDFIAHEDISQFLYNLSVNCTRDSKESSESELENISFDDTIREKCVIWIDKSLEIDSGTYGTIKFDILVGKANYGEYLYYRLRCDKLMENNFLSHPFIKLGQWDIQTSKNNENEIDTGNVVADNKLTRQIFKFLSMSDQELKKYAKNATPLSYRITLIETINRLWD